MTKKSGKFCRNLYDFNVIPLLDKGISVRMDYRGKPDNDKGASRRMTAWEFAYLMVF